LSKSRIGAGDSTVAGIVLGLTQGMDLKESVMFGISCGASTVMSPGNELCQKNDVERIFNQNEGRSMSQINQGTVVSVRGSCRGYTL